MVLFCMLLFIFKYTMPGLDKEMFEEGCGGRECRYKRYWNIPGCKIYSWFDHLYCQCYCSCNFMLKIIIKILLKKNLFSFSPWPGTACLPRSHLSLKGILYLWSAMMKSLLYLPAWHSLLSALQSPSLSSHLIVELQQWYPVTGCS